MPLPVPRWPRGTVVVLATVGEGPHVIPVSAAVSDGEGAVLLALAAGRGSLARLRADARVAVLVLAGGNLAATLYGHAEVVDEELLEGVVGVRVRVDRVADHGRPTFVIDSGVSWRWSDDTAAARDAEVQAALARCVRHLQRCARGEHGQLARAPRGGDQT